MVVPSLGMKFDYVPRSIMPFRIDAPWGSFCGGSWHEVYHAALLGRPRP